MTADELRDHRLRLGLTQAALASRLGLATLTVQRYEYGWRRIPQPTALLIQHWGATSADAQRTTIRAITPEEKNMSSNTTLTADHDLPEGWEDEAAFLATFAGQEYAARRWTDGEDFPHPAAEPRVWSTRDEDADPERPCDDVLIYPDHSALVFGGGAYDEVWNNYSDYLSEHDAELDEEAGRIIFPD